MTQAEERLLALHDTLARRVLVLDGAMGTMLQQQHLTADDFGGPALEGCNENLVRHPARRGPGDPPRLPRSRRGHHRDQHLRRHRAWCWPNTDLRRPRLRAELRRRQTGAAGCRRVLHRGQPRFVAGSIGPTTKAITVTGGITFARAARRISTSRPRALVEGGADYPADRNLPRHAQRQGRAAGDPSSWRAISARRFR